MAELKKIKIVQETKTMPDESVPQFKTMTSPITDSPSAGGDVEMELDVEEAAPRKKKKGGGAMIAVVAVGLLLVLKK